MDRIQAAIAKARAARDAVSATAASSGDHTSRHPGNQPPETTHVQPAVAENWAAVTPVEIDPRVLSNARIVTRTSGPKTAPFDVLRTRVTQQMDANGWKRLCITSPTPSCGKSTVALNLAFSLARREDTKIAVIDFDLRRPSIANNLKLTGNREIARAFTGESDLAEELVRVGDNLLFGTTSRPVSNPAELLQSQRIATVLDRLDADFAPDIVIFDLPPMMVSDDAMGFLPHADCALMIAAAEQSTIRQVDTCEQDLAKQTNVLGVVLNKCEHPGEGYGYGYGYGDGYGYGTYG